MASMTRVIVICMAVLAICVSTSNLAQDLTPGEVVSIGQNTYKIRITNELPGVADRRAMKLASEYCTRINRTMVVKDITFDAGYGYTLTWSCLPPQNAPTDH